MAKADDAANVADIDYEASLRELRQVLERLQAGQLPLPETRALYLRGKALLQACQTYLDNARLEVAQLVPADDPDSDWPEQLLD